MILRSFELTKLVLGLSGLRASDVHHMVIYRASWPMDKKSPLLFLLFFHFDLRALKIEIEEVTSY
jgi:hypothetical protein